MLNERERIAAVTTALGDAYKDGYQDGVLAGYAVAQRILVWWNSNSNLKEPHSEETLNKWSREELDKLMLKISKE